MQHEEDLLQGRLQKSLIDYLPETEKQLIKLIDDFSIEHICNHRSVVSRNCMATM